METTDLYDVRSLEVKCIPRLRLQCIINTNKPQQEGITTKPRDKELFILILQKTSNNN